MAESAQSDVLEAFSGVRPRLFGIAYRMLGSAAEAEDLLQDVWIRWQASDQSTVQDASAFLSAITTRLAINVLQSARSRREAYFGIWLPEPVDTSADPALGAQRGEALQLEKAQLTLRSEGMRKNMRTNLRRLAVGVALAAISAFGQSKPAFEVATVKPAAPLDQAKMLAAIQGGKMPVGAEVDNRRAEFKYLDLKSLILYAYGVKPFQVTGPDWMSTTRFDIVAKMPEGSTKSDAAKMLQSLLEERFRILQ